MEFDLSNIELSKFDINKGLILPKNPSEDLAEFIGILAGDGHISFETRENKILVTGNSITDYLYFQTTVRGLLKNLFNIDCKVKKRKNINTIDIKFYSKAIVLFLKRMGYYKLNCIVIVPNWIVNNKKFHSPFLRGLFDTDGCVFRSNKKGAPNYPCIELTTACLGLARFVKTILLWKSFRVPMIRSYKYSHSKNLSYKVSLYGYKNLNKWINEIGFSNTYKHNRTIEYKKWGDRKNQPLRHSSKIFESGIKDCPPLLDNSPTSSA